MVMLAVGDRWPDFE